MSPTDCLVLTSWMAPHQAISWQEAVTLVFLEKADALEHHDAVVSSPSTTIQLPSVVRLRRTISRVKSDVKFSRANVYARDEHRCQYCGTKKPARQLNYDHVIPRARDGRTVWENIATSCIPCNLRKDCRTPEEAGMKILRKPMKPRSLPLSGTFIRPAVVPPSWVPYLGEESLEAFA